MKRIILSNLKCLPKLVNGKVAIVIENDYILARVPYTISIKDDYNPMDYSLLNDEKWTNLIVYSTPKEKEAFLVNKQFQSLYVPKYRVGDSIHIHSRRGIYKLIEIRQDSLIITCKKWQYEENPLHEIPKNDFQCLAGGVLNASL